MIKKNKLKCSNVLIHDSARPNISKRLIRKIINNSKKNAVVPKMPINDALKSLFSNNKILNLTRENFFLTQTPQSYNFKNILNLHLNKKLIYKDDDLSLLDSLKKVKFVGNDLEMDPGIGTCGKNGQGVPLGVGQPTLKINNLTVGGTSG